NSSARSRISWSTPCTAEASTIAGTLPSPAGMLSQQSNAPPERESILMVCPAMCVPPGVAPALPIVGLELNARRIVEPGDRAIDGPLDPVIGPIRGRAGRCEVRERPHAHQRRVAIETGDRQPHQRGLGPREPLAHGVRVAP